jgi:hypothetical protein
MPGGVYPRAETVTSHSHIVAPFGGAAERPPARRYWVQTPLVQVSPAQQFASDEQGLPTTRQPAPPSSAPGGEQIPLVQLMPVQQSESDEQGPPTTRQPAPPSVAPPDELPDEVPPDEVPPEELPPPATQIPLVQLSPEQQFASDEQGPPTTRQPPPEDEVPPEELPEELLEPPATQTPLVQLSPEQQFASDEQGPPTTRQPAPPSELAPPGPFFSSEPSVPMGVTCAVQATKMLDTAKIARMLLFIGVAPRCRESAMSASSPWR